ATSPRIGVAFHSMSVSVRDATYFGIVFILSANGPSSCSGSGHAAAKPSYVTRPSSSASLANSRSIWSLASLSSQYGLVHPPTSAPCVPGGSCMTPSTDTYSAATIFPIRTSTLGAVSLNRVLGGGPGWESTRLGSRASRYLMNSCTSTAPTSDLLRSGCVGLLHPAPVLVRPRRGGN